MTGEGSATPPGKILLDETDKIVKEYDRCFQAIAVEGIDLAYANRLSFYISVQAEQAFASRSLRERALSAILDYAVFFRARFRAVSPPQIPPPSSVPKVLFFFEGVNPSVDGTLRTVMEQFGGGEARAVIAYPEDLKTKTHHEWIDLPSFLTKGLPGSLAGLDRAIRACQQKADLPVLRRLSLRAWMLRMALRTGRASRAFHRLYEALPTRVLVTASDAGFWGRCATLEANRRGIPSLTLQHGMMVGEAGYVPVISNYIGAWGEGSARWLRERGVPAEKIVVTGPPRLDRIVTRRRRSREEIARALALNAALRWVVLATNPIPFARNAALLRTAREGVKAWGEKALLLVKLHPSEDPAPYGAAIGEDPGVRLLSHGLVDLYDLLGAADAVLTYHSSVGLEAMVLDRPVVSLEAFGEENPLPYARDGAASAARTGEELARSLREDVAPGMNAPARRAARDRFVRENLFATDGKSAERVSDFIRLLARGGA